jgi:hypothetical protein
VLFLQIQALPALGSSYIMEGPAQVEILHKSELNTRAHGQLYMRVQRGPAEIQPPT